jgi:hypothetical protein
MPALLQQIVRKKPHKPPKKDEPWALSQPEGFSPEFDSLTYEEKALRWAYRLRTGQVSLATEQSGVFSLVEDIAKDIVLYGKFWSDWRGGVLRDARVSYSPEMQLSDWSKYIWKGNGKNGGKGTATTMEALHASGISTAQSLAGFETFAKLVQHAKIYVEDRDAGRRLQQWQRDALAAIVPSTQHYSRNISNYIDKTRLATRYVNAQWYSTTAVVSHKQVDHRDDDDFRFLQSTVIDTAESFPDRFPNIQRLFRVGNYPAPLEIGTTDVANTIPYAQQIKNAIYGVMQDAKETAWGYATYKGMARTTAALIPAAQGAAAAGGLARGVGMAVISLVVANQLDQEKQAMALAKETTSSFAGHAWDFGGAVVGYFADLLAGDQGPLGQLKGPLRSDGVTIRFGPTRQQILEVKMFTARFPDLIEIIKSYAQSSPELSDLRLAIGAIANVTQLEAFKDAKDWSGPLIDEDAQAALRGPGDPVDNVTANASGTANMSVAPNVTLQDMPEQTLNPEMSKAGTQETGPNQSREAENNRQSIEEAKRKLDAEARRNNDNIPFISKVGNYIWSTTPGAAKGEAAGSNQNQDFWLSEANIAAWRASFNRWADERRANNPFGPTPLPFVDDPDVFTNTSAAPKPRGGTKTDSLEQEERERKEAEEAATKEAEARNGTNQPQPEGGNATNPEDDPMPGPGNATNTTNPMPGPGNATNTTKPEDSPMPDPSDSKPRPTPAPTPGYSENPFDPAPVFGDEEEGTATNQVVYKTDFIDELRPFLPEAGNDAFFPPRSAIQDSIHVFNNALFDRRPYGWPNGDGSTNPIVHDNDINEGIRFSGDLFPFPVEYNGGSLTTGARVSGTYRKLRSFTPTEQLRALKGASAPTTRARQARDSMQRLYESLIDGEAASTKIAEDTRMVAVDEMVRMPGHPLHTTMPVRPDVGTWTADRDGADRPFTRDVLLPDARTIATQFNHGPLGNLRPNPYTDSVRRNARFNPFQNTHY